MELILLTPINGPKLDPSDYTNADRRFSCTTFSLANLLLFFFLDSTRQRNLIGSPGFADVGKCTDEQIGCGYYRSTIQKPLGFCIHIEDMGIEPILPLRMLPNRVLATRS